MSFTHLDEQGRARMVDIGGKELSSRTAVAEGKVFLAESTAALILRKGLPKGNPFEVARIAGIQAAKATSELIPLCHQVSLDFVDVQIELEAAFFRIRAESRCRWATGVEMEALTAVSVAALTLYDMCKSVDSALSIGEIRLVEKKKCRLAPPPR